MCALPQPPPPQENSPLHHAVSSGHKLCVQAILEEEEDRRTQWKGIRFTLSRVYSAVRGLPSAEEEPDLVNATNEIGETPLHIAASKGDFQMVKMLVTHPDIDVNIAKQVLQLAQARAGSHASTMGTVTISIRWRGSNGSHCVVRC